jgi:hypothetical protein
MPIEEAIEHSKDFIKELQCRLCVAEGLKKFEKVDKNATERLKALTLQIFEGLSIEEIAAILGRTVGATKKFLFESKKKLQPYLDECRNECN